MVLNTTKSLGLFDLHYGQTMYVGEKNMTRHHYAPMKESKVTGEFIYGGVNTRNLCGYNTDLREKAS